MWIATGSKEGFPYLTLTHHPITHASESLGLVFATSANIPTSLQPSRM